MSLFGFEDKALYRSFFKLALPLFLQQLIASLLYLIDNTMVEALGNTASQGVRLANHISTLMMLCMFAITAAATTFTAHSWGKEDHGQIRKIFGITLVGGQVIGWLFALPCLFFAKQMMTLFTADIAIIEIGASYLRVVALGYAIQALALSMTSVLRGTESVKYSTRGAICSIIITTILNYLLILGNFGMPRLGVVGAAIATVAAQVVNAVIVIRGSIKDNLAIAKTQYPIFPFDKALLKEMLHMVLLVFLGELLLHVAEIATHSFYEHTGGTMVIAMGMLTLIHRFSFAAIRATAATVNVLIGKQIGANKEDMASQSAKWFLSFSMLVGVGFGILVNIILPFLLKTYPEMSKEAILTAQRSVLFYGLVLPFSGYNHTMLNGVLRGGGDEKYALATDAGIQWAVTIVLMVLGTRVFLVPQHWIYLLTIPGEITKYALGKHRMRSNKWVHHLG